MKLPLVFLNVFACFAIACGGSAFTQLDVTLQGDGGGKLGQVDPPPFSDAGSGLDAPGVEPDAGAPPFVKDAGGAALDAGNGTPPNDGGEVSVGVDAGDAPDCAYVHNDGVGALWTDCTPSNTYTAAEALQACGAYGVWDASACGVFTLPAPGSAECAITPGDEKPASGFRAVCSTDGAGKCAGYCWGFEGSGAGAVYTCACLGAGSWQ